MMDEFGRAFREGASDDDVRAVVLTGTGDRVERVTGIEPA